MLTLTEIAEHPTVLTRRLRLEAQIVHLAAQSTPPADRP